MPNTLSTPSTTPEEPKTNPITTIPTAKEPISIITDYVPYRGIAETIAPVNSPTPLTGVTQSVSGGAGGVSVESGQQQQPVWNVASLKLKEEAEGTPDYGALSSALGI